MLELACSSEVAKLYVLPVLGQKNICAFQVAVDDVVRVQVKQRLQHLVRVQSANAFTDASVVLTHVPYASAAHILEVDAESIVLQVFASQVPQNVFMLESLVEVDFFF